MKKGTFIVLVVLAILLVTACGGTGSQSAARSCSFDAQSVTSIDIGDAQCDSGSATTPLEAVTVTNSKDMTLRVKRGAESQDLIPGASHTFATNHGEIRWNTLRQ